MASDGVKFHEGRPNISISHKLKKNVHFSSIQVEERFSSKKLDLLVYSLWIFSKYLKCQKVANVVRWGGPMVLWEKPKTASGASRLYCIALGLGKFNERLLWSPVMHILGY